MVKRSRIVAFFLIALLIFAAMGTTSKGILKDIKLGLDLQGGFEVLYEVKPLSGEKITPDVLRATVSSLERRVNVLGVSEPNIQIEGKDRIRVQLAGVKDQNNAREILSTQAKLSFRDYNDKEMMTGADLKEGGAKQTFQDNKPVVEVTLKDVNKFKEITQKISSMESPTNVLAIWLDFEEGKDSIKDTSSQDNMISAPAVSEVFNTKKVYITGQFTVEEAKELAALLNAGALPVDLKEKYSTSVGAQFGAGALNDTIFAGIIGIALVFIFMLVYYRFPGFIAVVTLSIYIFLTLLVFDWMNAVLTLPGIAALVLGVGMAVDANIITYERIRDELKLGRSVKAAYKEGTKNSLATITDANLTTLLAAAVLFYYGTSSVKGFATTLIISILMSFITAVYGTRLFMSLWVNSGFLDKRTGWFGVKKKNIHDLSEKMDLMSLPTRFDKIDFVKHRKVFYGISIGVTIIGIIFLLVFRLNLGIDFTSGTRIEIASKDVLTTQQVKTEMKKVGIDEDDIKDVRLAGQDNKNAVVRTVGVLDKQEIAELKDHFKKDHGAEPNVSTVSPTVGKELAKNAMVALAIASIGIILYVSIRFEWRMAVPAVVALIHDAFFIITIFSLLRLEVDITFIAAVLTIVGYSINDTIVTFDRIRENLRFSRKIKTVEELENIVNISIRQTLTRSINTVLTVLITVIALMIFGSEAIRNFSIALFIGLICGVYSSLLIASQFWLDLKIRELKKKGPLNTAKEKKQSLEGQV
ncbi:MULTISPECIES: protein translocase subunit SecDF [unclassified Bacillus (in: firmicutes)]|uniref:protein translocase subunit SecDF n=1 Tax=unclassified Bacillus (in: firmicutes) TaxID=185979 RepID=UPI001BE78C1F|nr:MULTISPECIES: protein translocase subunit SecDF [unclassified Bacillus (in: firmicutes)]MBT2616736.1 protein translocase subunit SecDF [Bacillus sp. ISL-78]MBT2631455.1 protein translocase subunit SecDF [Bacillus sp. ISL-101]MBT2718125.1 protein translocase subunit SecDF [Bacillus sp. ISL-57]